MKYYVDKLNEVLPDLNAKYDEEKDKLSKSTEEIYKNIDARKEQIKLDKYWENYEAAVNEEVDLQADKEKLEERQQKAKNAVDAAQRKYDSEVVQHKYTDPLSHVPDAKAKLDQAKKALAEVDEELRENGKAFRANADEQEGWLKKAETLSDTISLDEALSDLQKLAKEGGVTISESVEAGIREGRYQIPETVKGLKNLIKFDDAVQAAGLSGTQIPKALAEKISNGEISVKDAMNAVEKLAEFDSSEAVKKAEAAGVTIPGVLRQKIASGEMSVQEAIEGLQRRTQFEDAGNREKRKGVRS